MNTRRAEEIIASSKNIEVVHAYKPVWIKSINKETNLAQVMVLGSKEEMEVAITELAETGVSEPFLH